MTTSCERWLGKLAATSIPVCTLLLLGCQGAQHATNVSEAPAQDGRDALNTRYVINDRAVQLVDGEAVEPAAPGSNSKMITRTWGEPLAVDLNRDGKDDAALIIAQTTGGSGTFYYLAAAIAEQGRYEGTAGLFLGDRIMPEGLAIVDSRVRVSYLARRDGESLADKPTLRRQKDVIYAPQDRNLVEVAIDFEGEADPDRMTLQMHPWKWIKTAFNDDSVKQPRMPGAFTLTFSDDGRVSGTTDCNSFQGKVTVEKHRMRFDENMAMTRMFCAGSQETAFMRMLQDVQSFFFTSQGQLIMELKYDSGSMFFK
jgi:heat shock protein HslJ